MKSFENLHRLRAQHPYLNECMVITDSDAHYLEHIHEPVYTMMVPELSAKGVIEALKTAYSNNDKER